MKNKSLKQNHDVDLEIIDYSRDINLDNIFDRTIDETVAIFKGLTWDNPEIDIYLDSNINDKLLLRKIIQCKTFIDADKFLESSLSQGYLSISNIIKLLEDLRNDLDTFPSRVARMKKYFKEKNMFSSNILANSIRMDGYVNSERYLSHISLVQTLINKYKEMI